MSTRLTNALLLIVMLILGLSGLYMLYGTWQSWVFDLHRIAGWSFVALIPWKSQIVYSSLKRGLEKTFDRSVVVLLSVLMAGIVILVAVLGLMWAWRLGPYQTVMRQTVIAWHWILGLAVFPLLALHVWRRWPRPRRTDFASRRAMLRMLAVGLAGMFGWGLALIPARARATEERPRRATTGSRGFGLFTGNDFPLTGESTIAINVDQWRLMVEGAVARPLALAYDDILALAAEQVTQTLDCTSGWFTVQEWQGVPLTRVLEEAVYADGIAGVRLISATAYNHTYPWAEAQKILLATHVGGQVLAPRHGYPLRATVPDRRGWFWVKWLTHIQVLDDPSAVAGGVLSAPRQTLRQF